MPAEYPWCRVAAASGGTEHSPPFPCSTRLPLPGWGLLVPMHDSTGTVLGVTATHSLSSAGHLSAWLGSRIAPAPSSEHTWKNTGAWSERDKPRGGFRQSQDPAVFPGAS